MPKRVVQSGDESIARRMSWERIHLRADLFGGVQLEAFSSSSQPGRAVRSFVLPWPIPFCDSSVFQLLPPEASIFAYFFDQLDNDCRCQRRGNFVNPFPCFPVLCIFQRHFLVKLLKKMKCNSHNKLLI